MSVKINNPCWKGLLASFILPGSGQFFQGRWKVAASAFLIAYSLLPILVLLLSVSLVPPILVLSLVPMGWLANFYLLADAWRPTPQIGWRRWVVIIVISIAVYNGEMAGCLSACRIYSIPSNSMSPTIQKGDFVFCLRSAYWFSSPQRGDIVVFPHQVSSGQNSFFEKRLVGLPGDVLNFKIGTLLVNGAPYSYPEQKIDYSPATITDPNALLLKDQPFSIPKGMLFVLGDNPPDSNDSRYFGAIPLSSLKGKITIILWPINRIQRILN